jgi:hypothetical protein
MIRTKYKLTNRELALFLFEQRYTKITTFKANVSAREDHLNWLKRIAKNNKHTMGTDL